MSNARFYYIPTTIEEFIPILEDSSDPRQHPLVKQDIDDLENLGCQTITNQQKWLGTGPFCEGNQSDCARLQPRGMWRAIGYDDRGDGSKCFTGKKVLCVKTSCEDENLLYDDNVRKFWSGTAPFCDGNTCDCVNQFGAIPYMTDAQGDGERCTFGTKQLCVRPHEKLMRGATGKPYQEWLGGAQAYCARQEEMSHDMKSKGLTLLGDLVSAIPTMDGASDFVGALSGAGGKMLNTLGEREFIGPDPNLSVGGK